MWIDGMSGSKFYISTQFYSSLNKEEPNSVVFFLEKPTQFYSFKNFYLNQPNSVIFDYHVWKFHRNSVVAVFNFSYLPFLYATFDWLQRLDIKVQVFQVQNKSIQYKIQSRSAVARLLQKVKICCNTQKG